MSPGAEGARRGAESTRLARAGALVCASFLLIGCGGSDAGPGGGSEGALDGGLPALEPLAGPLGPGRVVAVGGALQRPNAAVYRAVLDARLGDGPICIIPTASADPEGSIESSTMSFEMHGGEGAAIGIPISTETAELAMDDATVAQLGTCSGYWFVGGQQRRIADVFNPGGMGTPALTAIRARLEEGAVVSGSSAGAAILSNPMINGGSSDGALERGAGSEDGSGVLVVPGGGFADGVLLDQHFLARGRFARLVVALFEASTPDFGVGIDENTAFVLEPGTGTLVGGSQSILVDVRDAVVTRNADGGIANAEGIRIELLAPGDRVDLATLEVSRPESNSMAPAPGGAITGPEDPFERRALQGFLTEFASSDAASASVQAEGGAILTFEKAGGFDAVASGDVMWCMPPSAQSTCWPAPDQADPDEEAAGPLLSAGPFTLAISGGD